MTVVRLTCGRRSPEPRKQTKEPAPKKSKKNIRTSRTGTRSQVEEKVSSKSAARAKSDTHKDVAAKKAVERREAENVREEEARGDGDDDAWSKAENKALQRAYMEVPLLRQPQP